MANTVKEDLDRVDHIVYQLNDLDSAFNYTKEILQKYEDEGDEFAVVRANLYLGFILEKQGEFGKSVIFYLEGIRIADQSDLDKVQPNRIWLRRNLANIFRNFEANDLATKYNLEAIEIANELNNASQTFYLNLNQALVYENDEQYDNALVHLNRILPLADTEYRRSEVINQIGIVYKMKGEFDRAEEYFNMLLDIPEEVEVFTAKALHNLGEIHYELNEIHESISNLRESISIKESINDVEKQSLFNSYRNIGRYLFEIDNIDESKGFLTKAEAIANYAESDPSSFEIYKTFSSLYYRIGDNELGAKYSDLYFGKVQSFIQTQEDLQKKDRQYNFDLITQRYFDQVSKQERIANILLYSKITSGTLLALLLIVVGYNRYEKSKLRRSIEQELISLRVID